MKNKKILDHELMDRISISMDTVDRHILNHSQISKNKDVGKLILDSWTKLFEAYQLMGLKSVKKKKKKNKK